MSPGDTLVSSHGNFRSHLWADYLEVTDLQNAGKRGKMVDMFRLEASNRQGLERVMDLGLASSILDASSYNDALAAALTLVQQVQLGDEENIMGKQLPLTVSKHQLRGIDVIPEGQKITLTTGGFEFTSTPRGFNMFQRNVPPRMPAEIGSATSASHAKKIFTWLKEPGVLSSLEGLTWKELIRTINEATGAAPNHR